jgi:mannosyltransferase
LVGLAEAAAPARAPQRPRWGYRQAALAIVFVGFLVRLYHLGSMGLEFDEAFSVHAGFLDWRSLFILLATGEPHPPFFYSLVHLWYPVFGTTEFALRYATLIASVLTIPVLIEIALWLDWPGPGLVAAGLLALSPYQIWYAQEVRMYAPVALFAALAAYLGLRALRSGRLRDLAAYVVAMLLCLYTHYYGMFFGVFLSLTLLAGVLLASRTPDGWRPRLTFPHWLGAQVALAALFLPWLYYARQVGLGYIRAKPSLADDVGIVKDSLVKYSLSTSIDPQLGAQLALGFLAIIAIGFLAIGRLRGSQPIWFRYLFAGGYLLLPISLGFGVSLFRSMFAANYFMVSAAAFSLLLGLGVFGLFRACWPLGVLAGLFLVAAQVYSLTNYYFDPRYDKAELAKAIHYVEQYHRPGDGIVLDGLGQITQFWYYHTVRDPDPTPSYQFPLLGPDGSARTPAAIDQIMARQQGVWLLDYGVLESDKDHRVERYLARHYFQAFYQVIRYNRVVYYASPPPVPPTTTPVDDRCNGDLRLRDVQTWTTAGPAGSVIPLALDWQALQPIHPRYVVSWRLLDAQGHVVRQRDAEPADGFAPTDTWAAGQVVSDRYGMLLPSDLLPGTYQVEVLAYPRGTGIACSFTHAGKALSTPGVPLATVTVTAAPPLPPLGVTAPDHPEQVPAGGLTWQGYDLDPGPYRPGDVVALRLFWQVRAPVRQADSLTVRLIDSQGSALQQVTVPLGDASYPTSAWPPGRQVETYVDLPVPARAASGADQLRLTLQDDAASIPLTIADPPTVSIVTRLRSFVVPPFAHPQQISFANLIDLLGDDLQPAPSAPLTPGQALHLTLYWRDQAPVPASYKVFTHLVGPDGKIYAQHDAIPLAGAAPTDGWLPGEVLTDPYTLTLAPNAPLGHYQLIIGFYNPTTGARLGIIGRAADQVAIADLTVGE